jgi:hypothetical protein
MSILTAAAAAAASGCCAWNGNGAAILVGLGSFTFPGQCESGSGTPAGSSFAPFQMGFSGPSKAPFVSVLVAPATGVEDSIAGWTVLPNATTGGQTLVAWTNFDGQTPQCFRGYTEPGEVFVPGYSLCPGAASGSAFPFANVSYNIQGAGAVTTFLQDAAGERGRISVFGAASGGMCSPVGVQSPNNPFGTGAFTIDVQDGAPAVPTWGLPSWC